jgi:hypothetical protein
VASTKALIDDWTDSGLPREHSTRMALALDEHLDAKVVDKPTLRAEMNDLKRELAAETNDLKRELAAETNDLRRELAELKVWLLLRVMGLVVVQLGLFWAINRFAG